MPFIDWNGSGGLDSQDIATSVVMEVANEESGDEPSSDELREYRGDPSASGCLSTMVSVVGAAFLVGAIMKIVT